MTVSDVTLAVLAGGAGSRMGTPKANLRLAGEPILEWLLDKIQWPGPTMLVTAPGVTHPPGWDRFDREAVDLVAGMGPLRGILTALENSPKPLLCVTTVDMPRVSRMMMDHLLTAIAVRPAILGIMFERKVGDRKWIEPFPSVFRAGAADVIRNQLDAQQRSVQALCGHSAFVTIQQPGDWAADVWANLNTPADLAAFEIARRK